MKKYILPTFVSLILSSGYVLADEAPAPSPAPEAAATQPSDSPQLYQEMMEKRMAEIEKHREQQMAEMEKHRAFMEKRMEQQKTEMEKQRLQQEAYKKEVQALGEKLSQAQNSEERQRLMEEMEKKQQEMWQQFPNQFGGMGPRNDNGSPDGWGGPRGMGPNNGYPGAWGGGPRGMGPGNEYAPPVWGNQRGGMPPQYGPRGGSRNMPYNRGMPRGDFGKMPQRFNRYKSGSHHDKMEQHLENIENLLKEVAELLKK